jgi:hypothetical protein
MAKIRSPRVYAKGIAYRVNGVLLLPANRLLNYAKFTKRSPNMTEETRPQVLATATGFAAREAAALLRKHNIATAPLRAGLSEGGLERTAEERNGLAKRVSAIGQCRLLDCAAEAMDDSAFGLHLARQIDPRDVGLFFYAGSAAHDLVSEIARRRAEARVSQRFEDPMGDTYRAAVQCPCCSSRSRRSRGSRALCIWLYPYPAFLRYAAHSAGGYWARILPLASEIAS